MKRLSIVIPVYNEESTLENILNKVRTVALPRNWEREIVAVDDGSTDSSRLVLEKYKEKFPQNLKVILRTTNGGKGAALKDGFSAADGDYIVIQDADLEYDPNDYTKLLEVVEKGKAEIVFGSRNLGKNNVPYSHWYYHGGRLITKIFNACRGTRFSDITTCYKLFPKRLAGKIAEVKDNDFVFDAVGLTKTFADSGKVVEVPISYSARKRSEGKKLNWRHGYRCFKEIVRVFLEERSWLRTLLAFSFFFLVFFGLYFSLSNVSTTDDQFFHLRFAEQMREKGFFTAFENFKALNFSKMAAGDYFVYYNFLFYLVLIPFTYIKPLILAIKLYGVLAASFGFTVMYALLKRLSLRMPFLWTIALIGITNFGSLTRFFVARPFTLAPALLLVVLYLVHRKKYWGVVLISFTHFYWHSLTFFFPILVAGTYFFIEGLYRQKMDWKKLGAAFLGTVGAFAVSYLFSPGFSAYAQDILLGIFGSGRHENMALIQGVELAGIPLFDYIQGNILFFSLAIVATWNELCSFFALRPLLKAGKAQDTPRYVIRSSLFFMSLCLFAGCIAVSGRFSDYFIVCAGAYVIIALSDILREANFKETMRKNALKGLVLAAFFLFTVNMISVHGFIKKAASPYLFRDIASWLKVHTGKDAVIYNTDWSWFTQLYHYNPELRYTTGLEPQFFYSYNPRLFWLWYNSTVNGYVCEAPSCPEVENAREASDKPAKIGSWYMSQGDALARMFLEDFKTEYIVTNWRFGNLNKVMDRNAHFKKVFTDDFNYSIYSVRR